jgi:hypothetical protein
MRWSTRLRGRRGCGSGLRRRPRLATRACRCRLATRSGAARGRCRTPSFTAVRMHSTHCGPSTPPSWCVLGFFRGGFGCCACFLLVFLSCCYHLFICLYRQAAEARLAGPPDEGLALLSAATTSMRYRALAKVRANWFGSCVIFVKKTPHFFRSSTFKNYVRRAARRSK